ncbi:hypothetical protein [Lactobacillus sp. ESL0677]|uniref:hypothetical protein n=1 Tax=Lactobacillus sp. ESL0677 TaxID=2983208 RepID=UPI0023FA42EE|nr:hypothetical protein [Lactobacillus sp. ESL0677]WEV37563.1 hypothetical protein OZX76_03140 [Lactobacillus sp. ESL0677]
MKKTGKQLLKHKGYVIAAILVLIIGIVSVSAIVTHESGPKPPTVNTTLPKNGVTKVLKSVNYGPRVAFYNDKVDPKFITACLQAKPKTKINVIVYRDTCSRCYESRFELRDRIKADVKQHHLVYVVAANKNININKVAKDLMLPKVYSTPSLFILEKTAKNKLKLVE